MAHSTRRAMIPYLFIAPFIVTFIVFFLVPALYSLMLSFYAYRGYGPMWFVGLSNYAALLKYSYFWKTLGNVLFYYAAQFVPLMGLSFLLALALMNPGIRAKKFFKSAIFLPQVMAIVCTSLVFRIIFSTKTGVFSQLFGVQIPFLTDPALARWSVVATIVWRGVGWYMIVFLAGLTNISQDVLDAARVDGASAFKRTALVIIPLMKPTFMLSFIINAIGTIKMSVEPNMLLSGWLSAPDYAAPVINVLLNNIKGGSYGMAAASGWLLFVLVFVLSIVQYRLMEEKER